MNRINAQFSWMAQIFQPETIRLVWLAINLALYLLGAGAPMTGGGLGE